MNWQAVKTLDILARKIYNVYQGGGREEYHPGVHDKQHA